MPTLEDIMKTIAENLPSPYALDDVWTDDGTTFDLGSANADSVKQWRSLATAVLDLWKCPAHSDQGVQQLPGNWPRLGTALTSSDQEQSSPAPAGLPFN